ncbi:MAG TPA: CoB--CoM heterodisulfide reductase iron-sulfur subunit A family protein [Desulfomonilaceae bacterium]|nr:CoB--CoM heterodisulfide reductase iron-sulfur subunit A family protein [Desulfomonilaceae bacterium]
MKSSALQFDALVVGGGIGGLTSALDLADQGFKVAVVEKEPSIGGVMIALSKVFPTLDCSSCITTPRMAAAAHHPNIEIFTYTKVGSITRDGLFFRAKLTRKPRYVDERLCIGCRQCEYVCPVDVPHEFEGGMGARKAVYVPFATAIPQIAVLDKDNCMLCGSCEKVCPTGAVDYYQPPHEVVLEAKVIILATGFQLSPKDAKKQYLAEGNLNVLTSLQMERLLAPHGPYGRVIRPSDGKIPESVAYVQCAGSRDQSIGVPYCSRVCCMYAIKQAMLLSGALPLVEVTIYYMDIRAFGKGYEEFYQNAKAMGIEFVKAKIAKIGKDEDHNLSVRVELMEEDGRVAERKHDLVVLSLGMLPGCNPQEFIDVGRAEDGFIFCPRPNAAPGLTAQHGVFAAGTASGPKDIVDTIAEAGSAAMEAANYLASLGTASTLATRKSNWEEEGIAEPAAR